MNGIKGKLWAKLTAMFIFVISSVVLAGSLVAVIFMVDSNVFFDNGLSLNEAVLESCLNNKLTDVVCARSLFQPFGLSDGIDAVDSGEHTDNAYEEADNIPAVIIDPSSDTANISTIITNQTLSRETISEYADYLDMAYAEDNSNLYIEIYNSENNLIYHSPKQMPENCVSKKSTAVAIDVYGSINRVYAQFADVDELEAYVNDLNVKGYVFSGNTTVIPLDGYINDIETPELCSYIFEAKYASEIKAETISYSVYIPKILTVKDDIYIRSEKISMLVEYKYLIAAALCISGFMAIVSFIFVICSAGYSNRFEGLHLSLFDKLPLEMHLGASCLIAVFLIWIIEETDAFSRDYLLIIACAAAGTVAVAASIFIVLMLTIAARCKSGKFFHYTFTFGSIILAFRFVKYIFNNMKYIWRVVLAVTVMAVFDLIMLAMALSGAEVGILLWMMGKAALIAVVIIYAIGIGKIKAGCKKLSSGYSNAKIDPSNMPADIRSLAVDINSIGDGIQLAVDERTKSERLKTELITNVSHDLKTPLTSIVNYVDILSKQDIQPDTAKEHVEVLVRQSQRMKKLIDDLVEASKASAGAISVNPQRLDMSLLLTQAMTEYEERLARSGITPVMSFPDAPATVMVDGRLMWRVLDNLIGNICKYAQPQTRVYASVSCSEKSVFVIIKNISKYALNISSEELMERFVRGDSSRHTEGSGLGLSIARSLCDLQNVGFDIAIDGDLFKAQLTLARLPDIPEYNKPTSKESANSVPRPQNHAPEAAVSQLQNAAGAGVTPMSPSIYNADTVPSEQSSQYELQQSTSSQPQSVMQNNAVKNVNEQQFPDNTSSETASESNKEDVNTIFSESSSDNSASKTDTAQE